MSQKNPIQKSEFIEKKYKDFLKSSFHFGSNKLQNLYEIELDQEQLFKGPFVDMVLPFKRGKTLNELIEENVISEKFRLLGDMHLERPLYLHQEESIHLIGKGHNAIVTTGTGSGKTECFLYPILNDLLKDLETGNNQIGIRAIFLYPMNALVNDQIERIRKTLLNCPEITYGFFTGDTKEKVPNNYREKLKEKEGIIVPPNEIISREEIRNNPPHLLFTNYSMLEYLLIRPNDYALFMPKRLNNWKYVVLDEAHTYSGALGIEISMLMRRLTGLAKKKPRFILTSATLGSEGKSEKEIISFANCLTSQKFEINDIIFSKRIYLDKNKIGYYVENSDYSNILKTLNNLDEFNSYLSKYGIPFHKNVKEGLYELLIRDQNTFDLYQILKKGCQNLDDILSKFNNKINGNQLVCLIDLINMAEKNGIGIFDLKYHSFIRPLSGAFITLGDNQKLSLIKTPSIDYKKAFEVGNCRYCNSTYIFGKIHIDSTSGLSYLLQNDEIDMYENYGEKEFKIDYFLTNNSINDEIDSETLTEYTVCNKCGAIYDSNNLNAKSCSCGEKYAVPIYKVDSSKSRIKNNIKQCPCCGHESRSGVVKALDLGKELGTSIVGQILYESLDDDKSNKSEIKKLSLKLNNKTQTDQKKNEKVKQFLTFSDSRQQASFSAIYFDANHERTLRKRIIWEVIKKSDFKNIPLEEMTAILTKMIKEKDLFSNSMNPHKNAWIAVLVDLLKLDGAYDGEGLGLYYFDLDLSEIMNLLDDESIEEELGKYNIHNKNEISILMKVVFDVFKTAPAIEYTKSTLTPDEKKDELEYRCFDNYISYKLTKTEKNIRSFIPINQNENRIVRYVKKVTKCSSEEAKEILAILFINLAVEGNLFRKYDSKEAYQIPSEKYVIKNYKTSKYYICKKCGKLTPYNLHSICPYDNCDGELEEVDPDVALKDNYYRNQYKEKKIEKIVIKEHTAQLERAKAKEYQNDFKNKKINILSSSTTFEMGVDLGDLETVYMRNVPPTPANYVQRAGRAGRRKDSAAYVLTYCSKNPHDFSYFSNPSRMISGIINPPYFNVENEKIIIRHLMATCLGYFFRKNPIYFKSIDSFIYGRGEIAFKNYLKEEPKDLNEYINKHILPENLYSKYCDFKWINKTWEDEKMLNFVKNIKSIYKEYEDARNSALKDLNYNEAGYYENLMKSLKNERLLDNLSKYCVIPKYGFPVDSVELQIYQEGKMNRNYNINRDLKIAISEYAPDSEITVDGMKYTSKYIGLPKASRFPKHYVCTCENCNRTIVLSTDRTEEKCKYCGNDITVSNEYYIEPIYGFKTGNTKESKHIKPKKTYLGEISYVGGGKKEEETLVIGNVLIIETSINDEMLIVNQTDFYMCPSCGYGEIARNNTPTSYKEHKNYRQFDCTCTDLEKIKLGHSFQTDVARLTIPSLSNASPTDKNKALSFMYALLEGISESLDIERNDIDGLLELNLDFNSFDVLIFDNVPGGAGYVKRLINKNAIIKSLKSAYTKVSQNCCDEETSCYNCLRNYYNQMYHSKLKRKYAKEVLSILIQECERL